MIFILLYLPLATFAGLALAGAPQPMAPKLTFAYSVEIAVQSTVPISSPFGETAYSYFSNATISGPLVNATTNGAIAISSLPVSTSTKVQRATGFFQGFTSDGIPFSVREILVGSTSDGKSTATQQWEIGGNYTALIESTIVCAETTGTSGSTNNCFIVG